MINTGNEFLDEFLSGYKNELTVIYGAAATGKTTIAKLAIIEKAKKNKVIFLDTENGFSVERFKQLAGENYKELLENILLFKIKNFKEQQLRIKNLFKLVEKGNISLIVVDTIGIFYRRMLKHHSELANNMLKSQLKILKWLSKKIPVIITNQVFSDIQRDEIKMVGWYLLEDFCDCIIQLKDKPRKIILKKPEQKEMKFEIKKESIVKI